MIAMTGMTGPNGTLKVLGALGSLFLKISTLISAMTYETIQNTIATKIINASESLVDKPVALTMIMIPPISKIPT